MPVGKIFYRARMRHPLKDAIEIQKKKQNIMAKIDMN
jgi:hypothetical protein